MEIMNEKYLIKSKNSKIIIFMRGLKMKKIQIQNTQNRFI